MEFLSWAWDFFIHLDKHLDRLIQEHGTAAYLIIFAIVFVETGIVIMPFLPGDTLLFAAGYLASRGSLNLYAVLAIIPVAALCGDITNYTIGKSLGARLFRSETSRIFNRKHLDKTHDFFERYGAKTIILARFVPIVRTCAPFVAGMGAMTFPKFIRYCIAGALLWTGVCVLAGFFFGRIPAVRDNFHVAILGLIAVTLLPVFIEFLRHRRQAKREIPDPPQS
jgi:membrane-associated protein